MYFETIKATIEWYRKDLLASLTDIASTEESMLICARRGLCRNEIPNVNVTEAKACVSYTKRGFLSTESEKWH